MHRAALSISLPIGMGLILIFSGGSASEEEPKATIRGTLTQGGEPLQTADEEAGSGSVEVIFYSIQNASESPSAGAEGPLHMTGSTRVQPDGTFEVNGSDEEGISPGLYRIVVRHWDPYPDVDRLDGAFSEARSPIKIEITGDGGLRLELDEYRPK